jgi:hypothetical protein
MQREIAVGSGKAWAEALESWDHRLDTGQAERAAERFEAIARAEKRNSSAFAWCARAHFYLGDYEIDEDRRRARFEQGMKLGQRGIALDKGNTEALFWTSVCEATYAELVNMLRRLTYVPEVLGYMKRVWSQDSGYYHRGAARLLGQAIVRQPGIVGRFLPLAMPEISHDVLIRELRATVAEDPPIVLAHQTLAQVLHQLRGDRKAVREQIRAIEAIDPDAHPLFAPENHRDQPRALQLLKSIA